MKKISILKCLAIASIFLSASFGFAQVVAVPAGCRVVVAGIGGTVGPNPTGRVGQGGVVAMPDILLVSPFTTNQGGTFTFIPPVATPAITTATWSLLGDLSNTTASNTVGGVTGRFNGATNPPAGLTATILSYNRRYRTSEGVAPSNPSWARSNGQVRVNWASGGCGSSITFNVYKNFNPTITTLVAPITPVAAVPKIVGPDCLKPNTQYTYSVDQIVSDNTDDAIGFDSYYWSGLPAALANASTTYTSADRSSITFTTGATVSTFTLRCCYGRVNPNTADGGPFTIINQVVTPTRTTCVTKTLLIAPVAPVFSATTLSTLTTLNSNFSACLAIGQPTFTITYPNSPTGQNYTWSAPNSGWTFSNNTTSTTTTTVSTNGNNNPATLTLTITGNGCDPAIFNYQINRSLSAATTITAVSPSTNCIGGGTTLVPTNNTYTINASAVGVTLTWSTVPASIAGITLTPSGNTNSVTVTAAGAAAGSFTLQAQGTAPCSTPVASTTINVQPAAPTFTAGTPNCVARSASAITTVGVTPVTGATYDWTPLPAGVTISGANNIANPSFIFNSAVGTNSVTLSVK
uniref:hypothetical protein n=1 Tax=Flavobacterium sp. TaxID=239 RepID=UPI0037C1A1B2